MNLNEQQKSRYSRNILVNEIGISGQEMLLKAKVLIIGAGGLGCPAALYLAAAGVGSIGIADADVVDLTNLQRQIGHGVSDIGSPKVESLKHSILTLNPEIRVNTYQMLVDPGNIEQMIRPYDFIIDATDNIESKFLINDACVIAQKPFCHAGVLRFGGQLMTYVPKAGPCYRCIFDQIPPPGTLPTGSQVGVIGATAGVIGSLQALEAIKYITRTGTLLVGQLLTYDALNQTFRKIHLPPQGENCKVCGKSPVITQLKDFK